MKFRPLIIFAMLVGASAASGEPIEEAHGDWKFRKLSFGTMASTESALGTKGMTLGADCEDGVFKLSVLNVALIMTKQSGYKTEVSYDDGSTWESVTDTALPFEHLQKLMGGTTMHVRWHIREGLVSELFSLKGAADAIKPVAEACNVKLPAAPAASESTKPSPAPGSVWE